MTTLGQSVVVIGGFDTPVKDGLDITAAIDSFDTTEGRWRPLPDAPVKWTHMNVATIGATLYLLGGLEGTRYVAHGESFKLDPNTHEWRQIASMPAGEERGAAGVVTAPGRIYLIGGASTTSAVASCLEYDIIGDRWTALPALPAPRSHVAAMRMTDGTLIAAGGLGTLDSSDPRGEVWALSPPGVADRVWQSRAPMHGADEPQHGGCAYAEQLNRLICAGGEAGSDAQTHVDRYDPYLDRWQATEPMPVPRAGTQGTVVGSRFYVPGGAQTLTFSPTDTLYSFDPLDVSP